ncbi:ATP-binding protein [Arthrobacter sp. OAP107]|uniref:ATP-binding protein n=1 Tax=Arthrobacter sp. OAP107 TaxID=3156445 RepID=UPI003396EBF0
MITISVSDPGPGAPEDREQRIFTRGFSTKQAHAAGRGVGLALIRLVCAKRQGSVTVRNDSGVAFEATLPHPEVRPCQRSLRRRRLQDGRDHVFWQQHRTRELLARHGTKFMSWAPFGEGMNHFFPSPYSFIRAQSTARPPPRRRCGS